MNKIYKAEVVEAMIYRELPPDRYCYIHNFIVDKDKEIERLNNIINEIKKLDLYISEEDYDYEENPIDKYIPFDIEDYIKELKGDSSNE